MKNRPPINDINLKYYSNRLCSTESSAGGTLLYSLLIIFPINIETICAIFKSTELEATFIEVLKPNKTNVIMGCIYPHPHMDLNEFNDYYLHSLLDKLSKENKTVFLIGDFNVDLLKYDQHPSTNKFLDPLSTRMLLNHIIQETRIRNNSKTIKTFFRM